MKYFVRSLLVVSTLLVAQSSFAGILVEPILGYGMGSYKQGAAKGEITGLQFGGRAGFGLGPIILAADIMTGSNEIKPDGGVAGDADVTSMGLTALFSPPVLPLRVWAGYAFDVEAKPEVGGKLEGTALKVGAGYSMIPFVSVNLEYIMTTFDKSAGVALTDKMKANTVFVSVSVPLGI
jgi:hypothetical protein